LSLELRRAGRGGVRGAHGRALRGLPSLLRAPELPHRTRLPARPRLPRRHLRTARRTLVGRQPPASPPALRRPDRPPLPTPRGPRLEPRRMDPLQALREDQPRPDSRLRPVPGAPLAGPSPPRAAAGDARDVAGARRDSRGDLGSVRLVGGAVAPDLRGQLGRPRLRLGPLRDRRRLEEQPGARAAHPGRGLAQQPPPLPGVVDLRILPVGDRPDLLGAAGAERHRAHLGPAPAAGLGARRRRTSDLRRGPERAVSRQGLRTRSPLEWLHGSALDARRDILGFYRRCEQEGGVVRTHIWRLPVYVVTDPELVEEILIRKRQCFIKSAGLRSTRLAFGQGLLTSDHELWLRQRRTVQAAFHARQLELYRRSMEEACRRLLDGFRDGETRNIHHDMTELCFEVLARSLFGEELPEAHALVAAT